MEEYMLPCLFKSLTGIPCPGCGGQRAVLDLLNGNFIDAFLMYPAIYPLLILGGLVVVNLFFPFKQYSKLMTLFGIISATTMLINYGLELNHHFNLI